jgi:RNA polymerase subunit RPABC4/transcription elongation factor Spt4
MEDSVQNQNSQAKFCQNCGAQLNPDVEFCPGCGTAVKSSLRKRSGCLSTWLILMIIVNSISSLINLIGNDFVRRSFPMAPGWMIIALGGAGIFNVVCAVALMKWKKWGFWGLLVSCVLVLIINLTIGLGLQSLGGILGIVILFILLTNGKENSAWSRME